MSDENWQNYDIKWAPKKDKPKPISVPGMVVWPAVLLVCFVGVVAFVLLFARTADMAKKSVTNAIAQEAIAQYKIVEQGTDLLAKSVHAGAVAEAYLLGNDSENYHKWKKLSESWYELSEQQIQMETMKQFRQLNR